MCFQSGFYFCCLLRDFLYDLFDIFGLNVYTPVELLIFNFPEPLPFPRTNFPPVGYAVRLLATS